MKTALKWILGIIGGFVVLLASFLFAAALSPVASDPVLDPADYGVGASSVMPANSGLLREFPTLNEPADNPTTPEKVELGRLLFFDPVISQNNDLACASCHQPDQGFSDGQATSTGATGVALQRNTPTLWNAGYAANFFWDGRESSLEAQAAFPMTHPDEMGVANVDEMLAEIKAIPEYAALFDAAFGGGEGAVTAENVDRALAAFERTLISDNSPFDRYAAGDFDALTSQQRRGLAIFRSGATRCFECHSAPTFASDTFRVIGVESDDPGRAGVTADGVQGAFKVPTLRNIALTAPYMHDGSMATLEEVVDFYSKGGGRAHGNDDVDVFVNPFELSDQEKADLIAFLYALTDESQLPEVPSAVPSGLPVIAASDNPQRAVAASVNTGLATGAAAAASGEPQTIVVQSGEPIQAAVDRAKPGDTVHIPYGTYHETVSVDKSGITLEGIPNDNGEWPLFDGQLKLADGVVASGNDFSVGKLSFKDYTDNGVLVEGATNVYMYDIFADNVGTYGVYPVRSTNVLIERVEVTNVDDAGIYIGQSENVILRDSVAYGNVAGIEFENTLNAEAYNNHAYDNTMGLLVFVLPQLNSKISKNTLIRDNLLENNNHENFAKPGAIVGLLPPGVGILIIGGDEVEITANTIRGNKTAGIAVFSLTGTGAFNENELDVGPLAEGAYIHGNTFENNGYDPDPKIAELGITTGDVIWDTTGANNRFDEPGAGTTFPPVLPGANWPAPARNAYSNILALLVAALG